MSEYDYKVNWRSAFISRLDCLHVHTPITRKVVKDYLYDNELIYPYDEGVIYTDQRNVYYYRRGVTTLICAMEPNEKLMGVYNEKKALWFQRGNQTTYRLYYCETQDSLIVEGPNFVNISGQLAYMYENKYHNILLYRLKDNEFTYLRTITIDDFGLGLTYGCDFIETEIYNDQFILTLNNHAMIISSEGETVQTLTNCGLLEIAGPYSLSCSFHDDSWKVEAEGAILTTMSTDLANIHKHGLLVEGTEYTLKFTEVETGHSQIITSIDSISAIIKEFFSPDGHSYFIIVETTFSKVSIYEFTNL